MAAIVLVAVIAGVWGGFNMFSIEFLADDARFDGDRYYLVSHPGWLGDPGWVELHECNEHGLSCNQIYKSPMGYYEDSAITLDIASESNTINIIVDDEIIYTHTP